MHPFGTTGERALVIGAGGALGALTAYAFENAGWEVVRAGRRSARRGCDWRAIDLDRPATIGPGFSDVDVVINTVPHGAMAAEQFVLDHGGVLINTSALPSAHTQALHGSGCAAAGTVVLGAGIAPGLTSLVAAHLLEAHPEADEVEIVFTFSVAAAGGPAGAEFVYRNLSSVPSHDTAEVPLPPPFGPRTCLGFAEGERGWMGALAAHRKVNSYACFAEPDVQAALVAHNRLERGGPLPREPFVRRHAAAGGRPSHEPVAHWVSVRRDGHRLAAMTIQCSGDYLGAAQATLALAHALQDARARHPLPPGVFGIERMAGLVDLEPHLRGGGITVAAAAV
jgi:NAD(P)-dependent dehydrogenase (short-subunit alcohol dehydrogenase family)